MHALYGNGTRMGYCLYTCTEPAAITLHCSIHAYGNLVVVYQENNTWKWVVLKTPIL